MQTGTDRTQRVAGVGCGLHLPSAPGCSPGRLPNFQASCRLRWRASAAVNWCFQHCSRPLERTRRLLPAWDSPGTPCSSQAAWWEAPYPRSPLWRAPSDAYLLSSMGRAERGICDPLRAPRNRLALERSGARRWPANVARHHLLFRSRLRRAAARPVAQRRRGRSNALRVSFPHRNPSESSRHLPDSGPAIIAGASGRCACTFSNSTRAITADDLRKPLALPSPQPNRIDASSIGFVFVWKRNRVLITAWVASRH